MMGKVAWMLVTVLWSLLCFWPLLLLTLLLLILTLGWK